MNKGRLEAFSDGVLAILITIMVLELKVPHGADLAAQHINGKILWANLHLLFWLSLVPFVTGWMGENRSAALPTAGYGAVLLCAAIAYTVLQNAIVAQQGPGSKLAEAVKRDTKGKLSLVLYIIAIPSAFFDQWIADGIYVAVALMWLVPDRRIEARLRD